MKDFLDYASNQYYQGTPVISDEEFDLLADANGYHRVGHTVTNGVKHVFRMYSLKKYVVGDDLPDLTGYIQTPKLDGAAVSLIYLNGKLVQALTRGDGILGRDITDKLRVLAPTVIPTTDVLQITGEVVCPKTVENARNVAAGSLNLKDLEEFKERPLTFIAYDVKRWDGRTVLNHWTEAMDSLSRMGFNVVTKSDWSEFPQDGKVFRLDDNFEFHDLGYTDKHPRAAFALKEPQEGKTTTLKDVVWQVGKSGVVSPVAILEPVILGEAKISRATLHNIQYIDALGLEIGCTVEVIRAGEIIPRVVRRVD